MKKLLLIVPVSITGNILHVEKSYTFPAVKEYPHECAGMFGSLTTLNKVSYQISLFDEEGYFGFSDFIPGTENREFNLEGLEHVPEFCSLLTTNDVANNFKLHFSELIEITIFESKEEVILSSEGGYSSCRLH